MKIEGTKQSQIPKDEDYLDGDFPIEGDGGTVDTAGQAQVPPPRPPQNR